ncbi:HAD family hydrolase [Streptomyces sp. NEAU-Y11]|uniref:HAD family hydrolase n=1 Tax=Streptomyces cucumeris TaxID=2962890 RepID=UPI0020C9333E|nr:haloacid dehalogenase-like hydrolase [Streptomyces sp. NEAU-Y11]MCP9209616.1 haloacid dehalogenase-like hydrolase [Streptomyces sp. NEAU-Y11]
MRSAYLDIDGTLVEDGLWLRLIEQLINDDLGDKEPLLRCMADLKSPHANGMEAVRREIPVALKHVGSADMEAVLERAWDRVEPFPFARPLARLLMRKGVGVILVSGAPQALAEKVGALFGAEAVYGCVLRPGEETFDRFIGSSEAKGSLTRYVAQERDDDLGRVMAMGNGRNDVGMLEQVGFPFAFEPSGELRREAEIHGWRITDRAHVMDDIEALSEVK